MSSKLPPYSTYRTNKSQMLVPQAMSKNNILTFTPRGFNQAINVKFPDGRLAVCEKCKKNYKTKETCRVKNGHTCAPWSTAYICVTLDDSCLDQNGNLYKEKPLTVRMSNWKPVCLKKKISVQTPVCASCKRTNRTKGFCRQKHQHQQPPWCTVYVILSAADSTDPSTVVAAPSQLSSGKKDDDKLSCTIEKKDGPNNQDDDQHLDDNDTDDIYSIEPSRTFLAQVSTTTNTIHWLKYMEGETEPVTTEYDVKALNDAIRTPSMPPVLPHNTLPPQSPMSQYPIISPQQQQQYYFEQQQQWAAWHAQFGHTLMPPPMIPFPIMMMPPPFPPPPQQTDGNSEQKDSSAGTVDTSQGKNKFDPTKLTPPSPEAYMQWHANLMFHQQMNYQKYASHQLPNYTQQHPNQNIPQSLEAGNGAAQQDNDMDKNYKAQPESDEPQNLKRQKLEEPNFQSMAAETTLVDTDQIEPSPIDAAVGISPIGISTRTDSTSPIDPAIFQGALADSDQVDKEDTSISI